MMALAKKLIKLTVSLAIEFEQNFLEIGRALRELYEIDRDEFNQALKAAKLGRRKGYYLVAIDRAFGSATVSKYRLRRIGWTKLAMLSPHIDKYSCSQLLTLAEECTAKELETILRGEDPTSKERTIVLYYSQQDYDVLEEALIAFGGIKTGRVMMNREEALLQMAQWAIDLAAG
ncbi:hypothetical protein [Silvimonas sp.]|uniref:hypothetical protein n=1 Tax=Silvimonas sp. TaxID=2650811 RepID=UPI00284CC571|nr:hypothetical protein [Silvimonas sp.]MDR3425816.1 hypothetical protein [Silvimonas sp.]